MSAKDPSAKKHTLAAVEGVQDSQPTELALPGFSLMDGAIARADAPGSVAKPSTAAKRDADEEAAWEELQEATSIQANRAQAPVAKTELHQVPFAEGLLPHGQPAKLPPTPKGQSGDLPSAVDNLEHTSHSQSGEQVWSLSEGTDDSGVMVLSTTEPDNHESTCVTTNVHREDFSPTRFQDKPRYQQRGLLAKGGMGFVRRVFDHRILRSTAMKLLKPELAAQKTELQRFLSEAQITGQLEHPNIVPVHDVGVDDAGRYFFTMQMVRGRTLRRFLSESHYDPSQEASLFQALQIFLKVCDALAFAHSRGILHRDLKPANIMVGDFGEVYLMDWGIASVLHQKGSETMIQEPIYLSNKKAHQDLDTPGSVIGSVSYIAPEQANGLLDQLDKRTDIFSLGAILYQILTLTPPYKAKTFPALLMKARACDLEPPQERVPDIHLPKRLCDIAMKAMAREPDQRYQSVHELKADIESFMHGDDRFPRKRFTAGTTIIREGEEGDMAYGILKGRCLVYKVEDGERIELREMGPGEVFGEASVLAAQDRSATVEAIDDVMVTCLSRSALGSAFGSDSWMGRLVQTIALRFNDIDRQVSDLRRNNKLLLLANRLLAHAHTFGQRTEENQIQIQWSIICLKLAARTGWLDEELQLAIARIDGCIVEPALDRLTIDLVRYETWLDQAANY